jgi:DNA-binding NtrC family response regulator
VGKSDESVVTEHRPVTAMAAAATEPLCGTAFVGRQSFAFELPAWGPVDIGRGVECDLQLVGSGISRAHARLTMAGDRAALTDLQSRNGTLLNQSLLAGPSEVGHGDELGVGDARIILLRKSALPVGVVPVLLRRAFVQRVDRDIAEHRSPMVFVLQLPERWYEIDAAREVVSKLARSTVVGFYDDHVLAFAVPWPKTEALTLVASSARTLRIAGVDVTSGVASEVEGDGEALLTSALAALLRAQDDEAETAETPVVTTPSMVRLHEEARRIALSPITVLLNGETGVGKEVFARTIHRASGRTGPLVAINTAALPEQLLESELFGHERGAFSGANVAKAGLIESAHGGTLFLDEIGELPLTMQAKLLRVLEERTVRRVGATSERKVDVRVIAATNCDLEQCVAEKRFRRDLLFRLNGCTLTIPPLRERREEIARLAEVFLVRAAASMRAPEVRLTKEAIERLERHTWPGNVRELRNVIERAVALCAPSGEAIAPKHLPAALQFGAAPLAGGDGGSGMGDPPAGRSPGGSLPAGGGGEDVRDSIRDYERARILAALDEAAGNQTKAAERLGLPRRTLAYKMARLGIRAK